MGALRQAVDIPIDLYIEVPDNFGGFVRYYEMTQLVRVAAPIYLKFGLRNAPDIYPCGRHIEDLAVKMGQRARPPRAHRARPARRVRTRSEDVTLGQQRPRNPRSVSVPGRANGQALMPV